MTWVARAWARMVAIWRARATVQPHHPATFPHSDRFRERLTMDETDADRQRRMVEELHEQYRRLRMPGNGHPK